MNGGKPQGLPDLEFGEYLIDALFEVGPSILTAEHELPINWTELEAYANCTLALTEPWEFRLVRQMSLEYLKAKRAGTNPLSIAPVDMREELDD